MICCISDSSRRFYNSPISYADGFPDCGRVSLRGFVTSVGGEKKRPAKVCIVYRSIAVEAPRSGSRSFRGTFVLGDERGNYSLLSEEFSRAITPTFGRAVDNRARIGEKILPENMLFGESLRRIFFSRYSVLFREIRASPSRHFCSAFMPAKSVKLEGYCTKGVS